MNNPIVLGILGFLIVSVIIGVLSNRRSRAVGEYLGKILIRIGALDRFDIEDGKPEKAAERDAQFEAVSESEMMRQWWRPLDSFYRGCDFSDGCFIEAQPGSYTVKTTKVEEEKVHV